MSTLFTNKCHLNRQKREALVLRELLASVLQQMLDASVEIIAYPALILIYPADSGARPDILVHMEQIIGIVLGFDFDKALVIVTVGCFDTLLSFIHHHIDICATR